MAEDKVNGLTEPDVHLEFHIEWQDPRADEPIWVPIWRAFGEEATRKVLDEYRSTPEATKYDWRAVKIETITQVLDW